MRILTFILSLYILALNFAPCDDLAIDNGNEEVIVVQDSHDHESELDLCSPFCECHCCHMHAVYLVAEEITIATDQIPTNIFLHFDSLGKDITDPLLQPPRV